MVCDNVTNAPNVGSLFRICDAFGVEKIIFCGATAPMGRKMTKTSRSTEKSVLFENGKDLTEVIAQHKKLDYYIAALEITSTSSPIHTFKIPRNTPILLIIGDENFGVSESTLKQTNICLHIEMFGQNSSMNVVQATNIALYEFTKQLIL